MRVRRGTYTRTGSERDGTTHIVLDPVDLLELLATFVPSPRSHMVRYHGLLAPSAGWRDHVVPHGAEPTPKPAGGLGPLNQNQSTAAPGSSPPTEQPSLGQPLRRDSGEAPTTGQAGSSLPREPPAQYSSEVQFEFPRSPCPIRRRRLSWAELLKRVFGIEALRCPCGKQMRVLAAITEPEAIRAILDCLNLPSIQLPGTTPDATGASGRHPRRPTATPPTPSPLSNRPLGPVARRSPRDQPPSPPRYRPRLADRGLDSLTP
jgi:hypothetical protein